MRISRPFGVLIMVVLTLTLYTIIASRMERRTDVIFGGNDQVYISSDSVSFSDPNAVVTPEPTVDIWPKINIEDSIYQMVNSDNKLSSAKELADDEKGKIYGTRYQQFSTLGLDQLNAMLQDMEKAGFTPWVNSSYRTYSYQSELFNSTASQIGANLNGGQPLTEWLDNPLYDQAVEETKRLVMEAGASEHQLGTAVDLLDKNHGRLDYSQMDPEFFAWLDKHCAEYGFIKRYPTKKLLLTGWDEPWHYRYVGVEVATFIMENDLCYEEFYAHYVPGFSY